MYLLLTTKCIQQDMVQKQQNTILKRKYITTIGHKNKKREKKTKNKKTENIIVLYKNKQIMLDELKKTSNNIILIQLNRVPYVGYFSTNR